MCTSPGASLAETRSLETPASTADHTHRSPHRYLWSDVVRRECLLAACARGAEPSAQNGQKNRPDSQAAPSAVTQEFSAIQLREPSSSYAESILRLPVYSPALPPTPEQSVGGAEEARTPDPLLAKEVLSQLSYGPSYREVVGHSGLEPETSVLSGLRSNQLS